MISNAYKCHFYKNWKIAYPIVVVHLSHVLVSVTDSIMVGRLGATPLAAISLSNVIFHVILIFGIGMSMAITPLVASYQKTDTKNISSILQHSLVINMFTGLFLFIITWIGKQLIFHLDQPEEASQLAMPYLNILAFSMIPIMIFQTLRQFSEGMGNTKIAMKVMLSGLVVNVVSNYVFIYGHVGFPSLGLEGAGWGSLVARIYMALALVLAIYQNRSFRPYLPTFSAWNYSKKLFHTILRIGMPIGISFIFEVAAFNFSAIMMGWLGERELAAHQIAISLVSISYMIARGIAGAATIRISNEWAQKNITATWAIFIVFMLMTSVLMVVCGGVLITGRYLLPSLYVDDVEVIQTAVSLIVIAGIFQLSDGIQIVCAGALQGLQDVNVPAFFIFVAYWIVGLPLGYWLGFEVGYGETGIWWGLLVGLTITAIVLFARFYSLCMRNS